VSPNRLLYSTGFLDWVFGLVAGDGQIASLELMVARAPTRLPARPRRQQGVSPNRLLYSTGFLDWVFGLVAGDSKV
jgi:hypothetical protein